MSAGRRPLIEVRDVHKTYAQGSLQVHALRGVSLLVREGEFVAIMGPSGSGKSTLMHLLGCLDRPSQGSCRIGGVEVGELDDTRLAQLRNARIGFIFQQFHLLPRLPAWRNVELPLLYARSGSRAERRARALLALEGVGLAGRAEHRPMEMSGGEQQRVAAARALVGEPDLILADEPTGNLDSASADDVLGFFRALHEAGRTIVLITHEPDVAARAERTIHLRDGQLAA